MTDTTPDFADVPVSDDNVVAQLDQTFRGAGYSGANYVAKPAPGFDTKGIWHSFGTHHRTGYAAHAIALHWMMADHLGIPSELVPHRDMAIDIDRFPKDREEMLMRWHRKTPVGFPELLVVSLPPDERMFQTAPRLVHYVAFEADKVSRFTAAQCNSAQISAIWCVSDFTAKSYVAGGVKPDKVAVIRPPICDGPWRKSFEHEQSSKPENFEFGVVGTWHTRKGFPDLIRAYFRAFRRDEPVVLKLRTSAFGAESTIKRFLDSTVAEIAKIAKEFGDDDFPKSRRMPRIKLEAGTSLTDDELIRWLGNLSCYVNPSYGEGLGIPPIWAMAQGVPVVSSTYGAVADYVREVGLGKSVVFEHQSAPVPSDMYGVSPIFEKGATWGGYRNEDLAGAMRIAFDQGHIRDVDTALHTLDAFSLKSCAPAFHVALGGVGWNPWAS